jgi:hypothetical protein
MNSVAGPTQAKLAQGISRQSQLRIQKSRPFIFCARASDRAQNGNGPWLLAWRTGDRAADRGFNPREILSVRRTVVGKLAHGIFPSS